MGREFLGAHISAYDKERSICYNIKNYNTDGKPIIKNIIILNIRKQESELQNS
jgi:hypothetical protein